MERLVLEEALLRHDPMQRSWGIVGNHDPTHHTRLRLRGATKGDVMASHDIVHNSNCVIIMGIGGKPDKLLDIDLVKEDGIQVIRRFSGGGTVVVDHSSLWTTFIGRSRDTPDISPYPREIMQWSADEIFTPVFQKMTRKMLKQGYTKKTLVMERVSCGVSSEQGHMVQLSMDDKDFGDNIPNFALVETDYVLGDKKIGGNAQSIIKDGWLHHTSFLWDYVDEHMRYLTLPEKRPDYRGDRAHDDFLVKLSKHYGRIEGGKRTFFREVKNASEQRFELEEYALQDALDLIGAELGGIQEFYDGKCRTKVVELG